MGFGTGGKRSDAYPLRAESADCAVTVQTSILAVFGDVRNGVIWRKEPTGKGAIADVVMPAASP
jgi:hypothetical protein